MSSDIHQIPCPPRGFAREARYTVAAREKRDFHSVLDAKRVLSASERMESVVNMRTDGDDRLVLETDHPMFTGRLRETVHYTMTPKGLVTDALDRTVTDPGGKGARKEHVTTYLHDAIGLPLATYPEVTLPFILGWLPHDGKRRSLYAWINDRFVAKLYVESEGKETVTVPVGRRETTKVIMYPDLNDWVSLGSVLTRLAKPLLPRYDMWFEVDKPHRVVRFEGAFGPPGAPEVVLELL